MMLRTPRSLRASVLVVYPHAANAELHLEVVGCGNEPFVVSSQHVIEIVASDKLLERTKAIANAFFYRLVIAALATD